MNEAVEMFVPDDVVAALSAAMTGLRGSERISVVVRLAWQLRQRDMRRALSLCDEAESVLLGASAATEPVLVARLGLVRAEAAWLGARLDQARDLAWGAQQGFAAAQDAAGCTDACWLLAFVCADAGDVRGRDALLQAAQDHSLAAGDALRIEVIEAARARLSVLRDPAAAQARWGERWAVAESTGLHGHQALRTWVLDFHGLLAAQNGDLVRSTACLSAAFEAARASGQLQRAVLIATNIGTGLNTLGDHEAALDWMQRALELARPTAWPASMGLSLMQAGETLRMLGRLDSAQTWLRDALQTLEPLRESRLATMATMYLAEVAMDRAEASVALRRFEQVQLHADAGSYLDFQIACRGGQARALALLGRPEQALLLAQQSLDLARQGADVPRQIAALGVLAELHAPPASADGPGPVSGAGLALVYLNEAMALADTQAGIKLKPEMLQAAAREHARLGQHQRAYELMERMAQTVLALHGGNTTKRATAMEIRHQTERAQVELQHHRALAMAEAQRAAVLQQTSATLERLGAVGQEITAHLEGAEVVQTLARHVHGLLDAHAFAIYLPEADGRHLQAAFHIEAGQAAVATRLALDDPAQPAARCARERRELLLEDGHRLLAPMLIGERLLGVMALKSLPSQVFGERERLVCRTLCAYAAIALDNAHAHAQLRQARDKLVDKEKLAALGSLVAGVAHELNTPIGNGLLIASSLRDKTHQLAGMAQGPNLKRADLHAFVSEATEGFELIMRGLGSAASLVSSFKQVAVDQTSEQRRRFGLLQTCQDVAKSLASRIRQEGHSLTVDIPPELELDSYPGPLCQVLNNLIDNSLLHGFAAGVPGEMRLTAQAHASGRVRLCFADDGRGIAAEHLKRVFEPFFTTRLGQGGSGLGLSISYNIVNSLLQGQISVESSPGEGAVFVLDLPLSL
ncbi:MAG: tetratricopeptide repeat protein [Burkholderiaceae bacterium]|nr:tetratricopeptide repeat protein [Burkholderiaceae bacterium]